MAVIKYNVIKNGISYPFYSDGATDFINILGGGIIGNQIFDYTISGNPTIFLKIGGTYNLSSRQVMTVNQIEFNPIADTNFTGYALHNLTVAKSAFNYTNILYVVTNHFSHSGTGFINSVVNSFSGVTLDRNGARVGTFINASYAGLYQAAGSVVTNHIQLGVGKINTIASGTAMLYIGLWFSRAVYPLDIYLPANLLGRWTIYNDMDYPVFHRPPVIIYAVNKEDDFDSVTWAVAGTAGAKWTQRLSAGPGTIALVSPAKGGVVNIASKAATDPTYLDENVVLTVSLGDRVNLSTRFRTIETTNTRKFVGYTNGPDVAENRAYDVAGGTGNALGIEIDSGEGAFFYFVGVRDGVRTARQISGLDAYHHRFMLVPSYDADGNFDGYNIIKEDIMVPGAKLLVAELPAEATMMERIIFATNLAATADSNLRVDSFKDGVQRFVGDGDT